MPGVHVAIVADGPESVQPKEDYYKQGVQLARALNNWEGDANVYIARVFRNSADALEHLVGKTGKAWLIFTSKQYATEALRAAQNTGSRFKVLIYTGGEVVELPIVIPKQHFDYHQVAKLLGWF